MFGFLNSSHNKSKSRFIPEQAIHSILSLAKCDGTVLCSSNNWLGAGAIYWNSKVLNAITGNRQLTTSDILGINRTGTWAQGGYSMFLGASDAYSRAMADVGQDDGGYLRYSASGRTALVADILNQKVYLIVTNSTNTYSSFRSAIEDYLGITVGNPSGQYKGIMLDGSGSSQMAVNGTYIASGDQRELYEVIALRNAT